MHDSVSIRLKMKGIASIITQGVLASVLVDAYELPNFRLGRGQANQSRLDLGRIGQVRRMGSQAMRSGSLVSHG
jgi:hypothetical protein